MDELLGSFGSGTLYHRDTLTELNAISGEVAGDVGFVLNDGTASNNGVYSTDGTTWTKESDLPPGYATYSLATIATSGDLSDATGTVSGTQIANDAVDTQHIANAAVEELQIANGAVVTAKIAADAVTGAKIADDAVGSEHIADDAVGPDQIADDAVGSAQIADDAVDTAQIANAAVEELQIANGAVTNAKLGADAVDGTKIADDAVDTEHLANGAVEELQITNGAVTTAKIAADAVTGAKIADGAVAGEHVADDAILYTHLGEISQSLGRDTPVVVETAADGTINRAVYENLPRVNQIDGVHVTSRAEYGGIPVMGADGRMVGVIPESTGGRPTLYAANDLRIMAPGAVFDATIDQSAAVEMAHDAAVAAGYGEVMIEGAVYAPNATSLGNVHFRSATGQGVLTGTYRKRVIPLSAQPLAPLLTVTPAHLARFNAAVQVATPGAPAFVVIMSDSWGNPNQLIGEHSQFEEQLRRALRMQYGPDADSIHIVNRAIGATTWDDAAGIPNETLPSWYTDGGADWLDYVTSMDLTDDGFGATEAPDLVIVMFGQNQTSAMTATDFDDVETVLDAIETAGADALLVTPATPNSMSATRGTQVAQEYKVTWAAQTRAFAAMRGLGVIDFGRAFDAAHWGEDLLSGYFKRVAEDEAETLTYSWPEECRDFAFELTIDGTDADFWADGDLTIQLSDVTGNTLVLSEDAGGNLAYTINAATGKTSVATTVTDLDATVGSSGTITVSVMGPWLIVQWRGSEVYNGPVHRGGGLFTPSLSNGASSSITVDFAAVGEYPAVIPSMTAADAWGETDGEYGGNEENHLSEKGRSLLFTRALLETRFR
ncbi:MAG: hypothetical protein CML68_13415 [Rhodobacteraceae bacterium]|nr:hypothetical protein [Paracoccaceae bacterium]